jgi:hypothetical protein
LPSALRRLTLDANGSEDRMIRLAQWLQRRANSLCNETVVFGSSQTVRTVETVESQERTIVIGLEQVGNLETCPLCGNKLGSTAEEPWRPQLLP